nr:hypothetical protein Iba_chr08fCG2040 [Ipomoea batatas]
MCRIDQRVRHGKAPGSEGTNEARRTQLLQLQDKWRFLCELSRRKWVKSYTSCILYRRSQIQETYAAGLCCVREGGREAQFSDEYGGGEKRREERSVFR